MKSQLNYAPLYASVYILQLVAVLTIAAERMAGDLRVGFVAMFAPVLAGTLLFGYAKRDWVANRGQPVQFLPLLVMPALIAFWVTFVGPRYLFIIAGLSLLAGRNLVLVTRRSLYFDLAIATTAFYDAIGLQTSLRFGLLAAAFLVALVFVLMADYADQRLDLVRVDGEARAALAPNLGNAGLATVLVLIAGTLISRSARPSPRGPLTALALSKNGKADTKAKPSDSGTQLGRGADGKSGVKGKPSDSGTPRSGDRDQGKESGKGGDKSEAKGKPSDSGTPQPGDRDQGKEGGKGDQSKAKGKPPGAEDRKSESKGEPSDSGKPQAGKGDQGKDGANPADAGESQAKADAGASRPGAREPGKETGKDGLKQPGTRTPSATGQPQPSNQGQPKAEQKDEKKKDEKEEKTKKDEVKKDDGPLIVLLVGSPHPAHVRTHVYTVPRGRHWEEWPVKPSVVAGNNGRFHLRPVRVREPLLQRYEVAAPLSQRIPAVYRPEHLGFPALAIGLGPDWALHAGERLQPGARYAVLSMVEYVGERPTGGIERDPEMRSYGAGDSVRRTPE